MQHSIPYGRSYLEFHLPDETNVEVIAPRQAPAAAHPLDLVIQALNNPLGDRRLEDFKGVGTAAIAVNDKTRPVPHRHLLPPLLDKLEGMGVKPDDITILIATGSHPPMDKREFPEILPENILARYRVISHDAAILENLIDLGRTSHGTPVTINKHYLQADLKIVVGNIEPHQFQGFSGGAKSAAIGLAGKETINANHAMMTDPQAALGRYDANPARQDVEEIGRMIDVHFALNAVLNNHKELVHALAGAPQEVMRMGIPLARQICLVQVDNLYDMVISSPGGHPKDINLYQSQKAIAHSCLITRQDGVVILAAACPDGSGSMSYENWMKGLPSHEAIFQKFEREGFRVGPHKAYQIARDASRVRLFVYSELEKELSKKLLLNSIDDFQAEIDRLIAELDKDACIAVMPHASATIANVAGKA